MLPGLKKYRQYRMHSALIHAFCFTELDICVQKQVAVSVKGILKFVMKTGVHGLPMFGWDNQVLYKSFCSICILHVLVFSECVVKLRELSPNTLCILNSFVRLNVLNYIFKLTVCVLGIIKKAHHQHSTDKCS